MERSDTIAYEPDIEIDLALELTVENDELSSFRHKENEPDKKYRSSEQKLIQEGQFGDSELSARIKKAIFGNFNGKPA